MGEAYGKSAYAIGNDEFVEGVEREILAEKPSAERGTDIHWPAGKRSPYGASDEKSGGGVSSERIGPEETWPGGGIGEEHSD